MAPTARAPGLRPAPGAAGQQRHRGGLQVVAQQRAQPRPGRPRAARPSAPLSCGDQGGQAGQPSRRSLREFFFFFFKKKKKKKKRPAKMARSARAARSRSHAVYTAGWTAARLRTRAPSDTCPAARAGVTRSPRPRPTAVPPNSANPTSLPTFAATSPSSEWLSPAPHSSLQATSAPAASALPPASPAATGIRFLIPMARPGASRTTGRPREQSGDGTGGEVVRAQRDAVRTLAGDHDAVGVRGGHGDLVEQRQGMEHRHQLAEPSVPGGPTESWRFTFAGTRAVTAVMHSLIAAPPPRGELGDSERLPRGPGGPPRPHAQLPVPSVCRRPRPGRQGRAEGLAALRERRIHHREHVGARHINRRGVAAGEDQPGIHVGHRPEHRARHRPGPARVRVPGQLHTARRRPGCRGAR